MGTARMSVFIPPEFSQLIQNEIALGHFQSEEEAVGEGLRLLQRRQESLAEIRMDLQQQVESLERGEGILIEGDEALVTFFDSIENEIHRRPSTK
jgi:putative addiction module CopG family antidote